MITKTELFNKYPELAHHFIIRGYLCTTLSIPEIQAQMKRKLLMSPPTFDHHKEIHPVLERFLEVTQAPEDIQERYRGARLSRVYCPFIIISDLFRYAPEEFSRSYTLEIETEQTCVLSQSDPQVIDWLRRQGIRVEQTWRSEIGRLPTEEERESR